MAATLLVQGAALVLLWMDQGWRLHGHRQPPRLTEVRLLPSPVQQAPRPRSTDSIRRLPAPTLPAPVWVAPPEVSVAATPPPTMVRTAAAPASAASAPVDRGRPTLNLALPKGALTADPRTRMAEQIRNDERSHSAPRTVESAIADAAGTLPVVTSVSTSGSGSKLVRQGSKCLRVNENRMAALHPTDDRLKDAPALAGSCFSK